MLAKYLVGISAFFWALAAFAKPLPINKHLGGDFALPSTQKAESGELGKIARLSDFKGKLLLLNFGYTSCPDICPMVVARMTQVVRRLGDDAAQVQGLFVTFDPARDTVDRLQEYLHYFNPSFVGFSGSTEQITAAAKQFGVIYMPRQEQSAAGLLYSHSDFIYLLDRQGRVRALYATDTPLQKIVDDIRSLLK